MLERRKEESAARRTRHDNEEEAAFRFYRPGMRLPSDVYAVEEAKREAAGLPPLMKRREADAPKHEVATDEAVYERFKKRSVSRLSKWLRR